MVFANFCKAPRIIVSSDSVLKLSVHYVIGFSIHSVQINDL